MDVPSIAHGNNDDRDLAEIDQDGFAFAIDEQDRNLFNRRASMVGRRHHRLQIVVRKGAVWLRKSFPARESRSLTDRVLRFLNWDLYLEAAALLRLRELPFVPTIRRIDYASAAIEMDYIGGMDLRHGLAQSTEEINYDVVQQRFLELVTADNHTSEEISHIICEVMKRGVMPRDVHAANFIRGKISQRLYMVDFHLVYLSPLPGWNKHRHSDDPSGCLAVILNKAGRAVST
jgi:hypothetical protein